MVVSVGVIVLRRTRPDLHRAFRVPGVPWCRSLAVLACLYLMLNLPVDTWLRFLIWMAVGLVLFFLYGMRRAVLTDDATPTDSRLSGDGGPSDSRSGPADRS